MSLLKHLAVGAVALAALTLGAPEARAGKFSFPYNHPDLNWHSIETEHFVVHYPVSKVTREEGNEHYINAEWSARMTAKVSEEMWPKMCAQFNFYLKEKIHIVVLDQADVLVGFTIPPWDWIEFSANPGSWFYRERGHAVWFSDVLVHEFAHVVSLKANSWHAEGVQGILVGGLYDNGIRDASAGGEIFLGNTPPEFWVEGGAEYWSDNVGYNTWTSKRDLVLRTTVLQDRLLTYEEWQDQAGKSIWFRDSERYYQQGYSFGQYLRQRFGDKTYAKFATESSARGFMPQWAKIVEEVTGTDLETLYNDWVAYATQKYEAQAAEIRARGEVEGRELTQVKAADWEHTDPTGRDKWMDQKWHDRERKREKTGRYLFYPRVSDAEGIIGYNNAGTLTLRAADDGAFSALTNRAPADAGKAERDALLSTALPMSFGDAWDFVPGTQQVVVTGTEHMIPGPFTDITGIRLETDGYDWKQLWIYDLTPEKVEVNGVEVDTLIRKKRANKSEKLPAGTARRIPNTLRGTDPSVSPDGKKIAYFEYFDGTLNLVTINLDGSDKKYLTTFKDGTWLQHVDWSPDGRQLVFAALRNYQKNLYLINADGSNMRPINEDAWEDQDATWAPDGKIYFSSDPGGVFNIYSYDPAAGSFLQITNTTGAAESPALTGDGNLLYSGYTSFGWKLYGLPRDQFYNQPADHLFNTRFNVEDAQRELRFSEDLSAYKVEPYKAAKSVMAPTAVPMFRIENDQQTNLSMQAGFQIFAQDYAEKNGLFLYTLMGEDNLWLGQYFNNMLPTTITLSAYRYEVKYTSGYLLDEDEDPTTLDDTSVWEIKNQQYANIASAALDYNWNERLTTFGFARYLDYGFKGTGDPTFEPYLREVEAGAEFTYSNAFAAGYRPNTFTGRTLDLIYTHAWTDIVYAPYGGVGVDDGMELDQYQYNKVELRYTENRRVPTFGGVPFLKKAAEHNHTYQIDGLFGFIDRNVDSNDEFRAGGQHPYFWGSGTLRPNTQFAGYPAYSLSGETMAMLNLSYRFPINQYIAQTVGPLFIHGLFAQVGGTAGNIWSFRVPDDPDLVRRSIFDDRIAIDPNDVTREIPFVDKAYKNGNRLLTDLSVELRMQSTLFHNFTWDSFVRVAYGFQEIRGYGDVDGDGIYDTSENAIGDELSNETEKPGPRVYLGLGTGW